MGKDSIAAAADATDSVDPSLKRITLNYKPLTLAPGETRAILSFGVLQLNRAAAATAADRLARLAPEAIAGLSAAQLAQVANFDTANIPSTAPLPEVKGVLAGKFVAGDGTTPVTQGKICLLYTSPSPRDRQKSRMPSSA